MKIKTVSGIMLTLLLTSMLTLAFNIQPAKAEPGTIYIRADGSVDPLTAPILNVGNVYYTFKADIYDSIVIERDNIVVDGAGYALQRNGEFQPTTGITLFGRSNVTIKNMVIRKFNWGGIYLRRSSNNIITGNKITDITGSVGIELEESSGNNIAGNTMTNNWAGIRLWSSSNNTVTGNSVTGGEYGIILTQLSNGNNITGNTATNNWGAGIILSESSNNIITRNNATRSHNAGIAVHYSSSSNNSVHGNNISNNGYCGVWLLYSSNNMFYHNNFINNTRQVYNYKGQSVNTWDDGYPSGGNYWSDYTGVDLKSGPNQDQPGSDGIGDTPYIIDAYNRDCYPLMKPWPPVPQTFSDDFSSDTGLWEYSGFKYPPYWGEGAVYSAYRDASKEYVVLTPPEPHLAGVFWFKHDFNSAFTVSFSYLAGGGSGADGLVIMFYHEKPPYLWSGASLSFIGRGYGIEFDNYGNYLDDEYGGPPITDPSGNHIAIIKDNPTNHLIYVNDMRTEDNVWHDVTVVVDYSSIIVYVDSEKLIHREGEIDRTYGGFGFAGTTGGFTNWHLIDDFSITIWAPTPPPPTVPTVPPQPRNIAPADGDTDVSLTPMFLSSPPLQDVGKDLIPWEELDGLWVTRVDSQWQITTVKGDYSDLVWDSTLRDGLIDRRFFPDLPDAWANYVPSGVLNYGTTYYWRVRHRDFRGVWSPWSQETSFTTIESREMKIARLITQEAIGGVPVTVDGQCYIILTLKSYIDPITLEVVPNVMTKVYVEVAENYPVSNPDIARKIGLVDVAHSLQLGAGSPENIAQKSQYLISEWLAYKDVEFEDEAVEIIGNWFSAIPGLGWLIDKITLKIKQLAWDPINELRDIANGDIQKALDSYLSAQKIATKEIWDYAIAYTYLKNIWEGEVYQNVGTSLLYKINDVGKSKLERIKDYFLREIVKELLDLIFQGSAEAVISFVEMDLGAVDAIKWADDYEQEKSRGMSNIEFKLSQQLLGASGYTLELAQSPRISAKAHSPVELRVYDAQGRVTGLVNGKEKNEIPYSTYSENTVTIFFPTDSYRYEVAGMDQGTYGLSVISIMEGEVTTFASTDIPTSAYAINEYTIDWVALSLGEEGVTVQIDSDGDGVFEHTFPSDSELTQTEYMIATDKTPPETWLNIGEPKFVMDDITCLTSATPIALISEDNPGGSGVASTVYRTYNAAYDGDWVTYTQPFYLSGLNDGTYFMDYYSTDNVANIELTNTVTVILDNTPPATSLTIGEPKYVAEIIYVTSETPFMLEADDNAGSGVYSIAYKIYDSAYDCGWLPYTTPFFLTGLTDGAYTIEFNSTDNVGNMEPSITVTVILDNTGPSVAILNPPAGWALQDGVTFIISAIDVGSGVSTVNFSIREANGGEGTPVGFEDLPVTYNATTGKWTLFFDTLQLPDGYYVVLVKAKDNLGNMGTITVPYSIRNWAVIELLPASETNKAGRTMPVKFSLRVAASVDPNQPFVYNEDLRIQIYAIDDPSNILQTSTFGDTARDYRISTASELYITNFQTLKTPMQYTVSAYRGIFLIGSFDFQTVK